MSETAASPNKTMDMTLTVPTALTKAIEELFALKPEVAESFNKDAKKFILSAVQKAILAHTSTDMDFQLQWNELEKSFEESLARLDKIVKK